MILILLFVLPIAGVLYFFNLKYNHVYKKFKDVYSSYSLTDTPEFQSPITLNLTSGKVPSWLNGILYRIGPGKFNIHQKDGSIFSIKHAFDGLPFMHRFEINSSTQTLKYNSRLLAKSVERSIAEKTYKGLVFFGHVPVVSFFNFIYEAYQRINTLVVRAKAFNRDALPDSRNVGVTASPNFPLPSHWEKDGGHVLVSKTDANVLQKIHAETLVPEKVFSYTSYDKELKGQFSAAHHQYDPVTKEIFNFTLTFAPKPRMIVFSTSDSGKVKKLADITRRSDNTEFQAPYIHSLWLTKKYIIVPESPLTYQDKGLNMLLTGAVLSSMSWVENAPTYLHVISREGGLVASIPTTGFFTFHVANGFEHFDEQGDEILTLDSASFSDGDIMHQLNKFGGSQPKRSYSGPKQGRFNGISFPPHRQTCFGDLKRYKINLTQKKVLSDTLLCKNLEFPRYNQSYSFKEYQFLYGCELTGFTEKMDESNGLIKVDLFTGKLLRYGQEGYYCSEPIFVPSPNPTAEDQGVLLTLVNNTDCCYLVVVDAESMTELARFTVGQFTAVTFHGSYVDHEFKPVNIN